MSTKKADRATAASDPPATTRSRSWLIATSVSMFLGLASAGLMTAAMFWIGDYYRGTQLSRDEEGRRKLRELQAAEQKELQTYGWINRTDGVVRVPIDRAMQLLAEETERQRMPPSTSRPSTSKPSTSNNDGLPGQ